MRERIYIVAIYAFIITIFVFMVFYINKTVVENGVRDIELQQAQADMSQVHSLMGAAIMRLKQHTYDWATWDEAYDYVKTRNTSFIEKNLHKERLRELHITAAAFYNLKRERLTFIDGSHLIFGEEWVDSEVAFFDSIAKKFCESKREHIEGFAMVGGVSMIVAAHRVYDSNKQKASNDFLVMASALDFHFKKRAKSISGLRFSFLPLAVYNTVYADRARGENFKLLQTDDEVRVYSIVDDIFDKPAFCLELLRKRDIAAFGEVISLKNFGLMLSLCIIVLLSGVAMLTFAYRRFMREEMNYRAKHDSLTGLPNGNLLMERLPGIIKKAQAERSCLGILYIDVDNFKSINDSYGYQQGDVVLREIARRLSALNCPEWLARTSVDNFQLAITAANRDILATEKIFHNAAGFSPSARCGQISTQAASTWYVFSATCLTLKSCTFSPMSLSIFCL